MEKRVIRFFSTEPERDRAMQMALPRKPAAKIGRRRNS
jgi:hypothetical protein